MVIRARFHNGVAVPESDVEIPDGTIVAIVLQDRRDAANVEVPPELKDEFEFWERLGADGWEKFLEWDWGLPREARRDLLGQLPRPGGAGPRRAEAGIVLQDDAAFATRSPMVLTVPLTTQTASLRFPATLRIDPSAGNGLAAVSNALLFQLRAIDRNWIDAKLGVLDAAVLDDLLKTLDRFIGR